MKAYILGPLAYIGLHFAYIRFRPVFERRLLSTVAVSFPAAAMNKNQICSSNTIRGLETQGRCYNILPYIYAMPPSMLPDTATFFVHFAFFVSEAKVHCNIVSAI